MMLRCSIVVPILLAWVVSACAQGGKEYGQFAPPDAFAEDAAFAYYGSENEWSRRMFSADVAAKDSKRMGQRLLLTVLDGDPRGAIRMCEEQIAAHPDDLEALFVLTCAFARSGQVDQSRETAVRALANGLPPERFLAGPQELLEPLLADRRFAQGLGELQNRIIHGPMLGCTTDSSARIWVRTAGETEVTVRVFETRNGGRPIATASGRTRTDSDRTVVLEVSGLHPNTQYYYEATAGESSSAPPERLPFRTVVPRGKQSPIRIAFGGCAGYTPMYERMWTTIGDRRVDALLLLGDNLYIDLPEEPGPFHRYSYYCRQSRPEFRTLVATTPVYAIWDDHDVAIDDIWLGPYLDRPAWKPGMLKLFRVNWNNPAYGNDEAPGCWFSFSLGHVDFFLLDCRYWRTNPFQAERTMLGPVQKKWLLDSLRKSQATFKVVASSVAWSPEAKPGSRDSWDGFPEEREEIFDAIEKERIGGVVLLSADRHRSEAWRIERPTSYPLYEFLSARLTNIHTHDCVPGTLFCYNEKCSFGLLSFDADAKDPQLTFDVVNIDGETVHSLKLRRSELAAKTADGNG